MNKQLLISIIVPIYNSEAYLQKCLESIICQRYSNLEIILIDDGSLDGSFSICKKYAEIDNRIRLYHQDNKGLVYTRKVGMAVATGDYIGFVDSDDYIDNDMISSVIDAIQGEQPEIVAFGLIEEYLEHLNIVKNKFCAGFYKRKQIETEIIPSMLSCDYFFNFGILPNLVCKLIKKDFLKRASLEVSNIVTVGEDVDVTFQLLAQANSIQLVEVYSYHYCKRDNSMMWAELDIKRIKALYSDLKNGFERVGIYEKMKGQLGDYITFISLLKNPKSVKYINNIFGDSNRNIAVYGAGGFGQGIVAQYKKSVCLWADKKYDIYREKGFDVISPKELCEKQDEYDVVYIAILNSKLCREIRDMLIQNGLKKDVLFFESTYIEKV